MPYSSVTFGALCQALAVRLGDTSSIYWRNSGYGDELSVYVWEALRTWQAYSAFNRKRCTFNLAPAQTWYDLTSAASTGAGTQNPAAFVGPTVTDSFIVQSIQYHLIENATQQVNGTTWVGTEMFTLASVTAAMQRALNQFLQDTGCQISNFQQPGPTPIDDIVDLPQEVIEVRRAAYSAYGAVVNQSIFTALWRSSQFSSTAFSPGFNVNVGTPLAWDIQGQSPLQLRLMPPPAASNSIELLTINTGPTLDPTTGVLLGILDALSPAIKWGAMADLLSQEGEGQDLKRAQYCRQRYLEFVEIARTLPLIIQAQINGVACQTGCVADADAFYPSWQLPPQGTRTPQQIISAGLNLIAAAPVPDPVTPVSVTLDIAANADIPTNNSFFVQLGQELIDAILDEAQGLAMFKQGGNEALAAMPLHENFVRVAGVYNEYLRGTSTYIQAVQGQSLKEAAKAPRRESDIEVTP